MHILNMAVSASLGLACLVFGTRSWNVFSQYCDRAAAMQQREAERASPWGRGEGHNRFEYQQLSNILSRRYRDCPDAKLVLLGDRYFRLFFWNLGSGIVFIAALIVSF